VEYNWQTALVLLKAPLICSLALILFYWQPVGSEIRQNKQGPAAINSKLKWLLSDPLDSSEFTSITSCNLILAHKDGSNSPNDLYSLSKQFWELETIGIVDNTSISSQVHDKFLNDIFSWKVTIKLACPGKKVI